MSTTYVLRIGATAILTIAGPVLEGEDLYGWIRNAGHPIVWIGEDHGTLPAGAEISVRDTTARRIEPAIVITTDAQGVPCSWREGHFGDVAAAQGRVVVERD